ncbi:MAG: hypothetical protein R8M46_04220 [Ghiorsea sp.]
MPQNKLETVIIEFDLQAQYQLLFQAMLQGEDGLAFVRCVDGVQQLWTTSLQVDELKGWLMKYLPDSFNLCILNEYIWSSEPQ